MCRFLDMAFMPNAFGVCAVCIRRLCRFQFFQWLIPIRRLCRIQYCRENLVHQFFLIDAVVLLRCAVHLTGIFLDNTRQILLSDFVNSPSNNITFKNTNLFRERRMLLVKPAIIQTRLTRPEHQLVENRCQQMLLPVSCKEIQIRAGNRYAVPLP